MLYKPPGLAAALGLRFFSMKASVCTQKLKYCPRIKSLSFVNLMLRAQALNLRGGGERFPPLHFQPGSLSACHVLSESLVNDLVATLAWGLHSRYHTSRSRGNHVQVGGSRLPAGCSTAEVQEAVTAGQVFKMQSCRRQTDTAAQETAAQLKGNTGTPLHALRTNMYHRQG